MTGGSNCYNKRPHIPVDADSGLCITGWREIGGVLQNRVPCGAIVAVECYPGVLVREVEEGLAPFLGPIDLIRAADALRGPREIDAIVQPFLTADPTFGRMNRLQVEDFFDPSRLADLRRRVTEKRPGVILVVGTGAVLVAPQAEVLVYADLARWEIQQRQRRGEIGNFGADNRRERACLQYKRAFFIDWRIADRLKQGLQDRIDFLLDTNVPDEPKMIAGSDYRRGLELAATRPFRVVPFFDPGPWGGDWMMRNFELPPEQPNYAWCFDCVPEENSLLLGFGGHRVEIPAIDLVFYRPKELLGDRVYHRFGAEFPIRFDLLDTMNGGNLSLQVHPLASYIREHFGVPYTQDESYYLLDAGPGAAVWLGLKGGVDPRQMAAELESAQSGRNAFPADQYVNQWPTTKHDHFLIPSGTIHCSGRNSVVLEISATPYIFTFKLWDWGRLGLDGLPRPIHLKHGLANIQWDRRTAWVRQNLINRIAPVSRAACWREERTGLHPFEFIETRRHWFTGKTPHATGGSVHVLNLVEGEEAVVESPDSKFDPFAVHYAETFIVPAAVGRYDIRPAGGGMHATIQASMRDAYVH